MNLTLFEWFLFAAVSGIIWAAILYNIIKYAVRAALKEAKASPVHNRQQIAAEPDMLTSKQSELKSRYERGEISLEEYRAEWNKL